MALGSFVVASALSEHITGVGSRARPVTCTTTAVPEATGVLPLYLQKVSIHFPATDYYTLRY